MEKTIKPNEIQRALAKQLSSYHEDIVDRLNDTGRESMKQLVKLTKATAPVDHGDLKRNIAMQEETVGVLGLKEFTWYAKAPSSSILHLVVHGHAVPHGDPVPGNPFLHNAWDRVRADYENAVEEVLKE